MKLSKEKVLSSAQSSLKYKLLASYIAVIIIPVLIGAFFPYIYTQKIIVEEANKSLNFSLDRIVESITYKMVKYNKLSNRLVNDFEINNDLADDYNGREGEAAYKAQQFYEKKFKDEIRNNDEEILNIRIYKKNDTLPEFGDYLVDVAKVKDTDWYSNVYRNKGVSYWKGGVLKSFNRPDINTISIINRFNQPNSSALLEIELRQDRIFDGIYKFYYDKDSTIGVIDENGSTITSNMHNTDTLGELLSGFADQVLGVDNASFTWKINDEFYLILTRKLNYQGWKVVVAVPLKQLHGSTDVIRLVTFVTVMSCIIVFLVLTYFLSNIMTSRLQKLTRSMQSVEAGDFDVIMSINGNDEISEMSRVFNSMVESIRNLIEEVYKGKIEKKEAELRALQEQINPHFLYNTLSSINWMAVQANSPRIVDIVESLAAFYRLSLSKGREIIPLKDEISQAKAYVSIQKIRYENSFEVHFEVDSALENVRVIKFIIQPFIENAIIHGFNEHLKGSIYVTAREIEDKKLLIRIVDNGKGMDEEKLKSLTASGISGNAQSGKGKGYGIKNVNDRIKLHYGNGYGVSISSEAGNGTIVEIKLPYIDRGEADAENGYS